MYVGKLLVSQHEEVYKMPGEVPGTEQAFRHSSYIIIHHVNTEIGFLPKIQEGGMVLDEGMRGRLVLRFLSCNPAGQQCHHRVQLGLATLPSL